MPDPLPAGLRRAKDPPPFFHRGGSFEPSLRKTGSDGPSYLTAAQAAGAHVNVLRGTVNDGLDALHIGLPAAIGAPMRVADLDAESDTLVAELTLRQA